MSNPYNFGNPVPSQRMVGRWDQIDTIVHDLLNSEGHSHIVVGGRRFGKSSFLGALHHTLLEQLDQTELGGWYIFPVLINLQSLVKISPEGVFGLILNTLYKSLTPLHAKKTRSTQFNLPLTQTSLYRFHQSKQKECAFDDFSEILEELIVSCSNSSGLLRLVFLLDEIEVGLDKNWTETLFSQLRSLIYQGFLRDHIRCVLTGSSQVIEVREQGSPLLNMLNITYLKALEKKDIQHIVHWMDNVPLKVSREVFEQCGGHPFIAQYLMHFLWEAGSAKAKVPFVEMLAKRFVHERFADLEQWQTDIGEAGRLAYHFLAESGDWLTEQQIRLRVNTLDLKIRSALTTLCYHGLAIHDSTWSNYHSTGKLFKDWFQSTIFPLSNTSKRSTLVPQIPPNPEANHLPQKTNSTSGSTTEIASPLRTRIFISYSHKDKMYLDELQTHLATLLWTGEIDIWDDTRIQPGKKWQQEIEMALQTTKVAILLISADFLASDFIRTIEMPTLLNAVEQEEASIFYIILRPCIVTDTTLAQFQAVNALSEPLSKMRQGKREEIWSKVTRLIRDILNRT
jgi:TIR domain